MIGHVLSVDPTANLALGLGIAVTGAVVVIVTAQLARLHTKPSGTSADSKEATRLTLVCIVRDFERGTAASIEMNVSSTGPDLHDETHSTRNSAQSEGNMLGSGCTVLGPSTEDGGEKIDSVPMTEHLQGIGATFDHVAAQQEPHVLS